MEKIDKKNALPLMANGPFQAVLIGALVVGAFFVGSLWTKVQILEQGAGGGKQVAGAPSAGGAAPAPQAPPATGEVPKVTKDDHVRGDAKSRIAMIEYSDLECPFCKSFHPTAQQVLDKYKGKIMWVYRHYPLSFHANAQKEAEASECAADLGGNDAFWKYVDAIYEKTTSNGTGFALDKLVPLAVELGLNESKFKDCLDSGKFAQKIKDQMDKGTTAGVTGTPGTILLDTKTGATRMIPGAVPIDQITPVIEELLKG